MLLLLPMLVRLGVRMLVRAEAMLLPACSCALMSCPLRHLLQLGRRWMASPALDSNWGVLLLILRASFVQAAVAGMAVCLAAMAGKSRLSDCRGRHHSSSQQGVSRGKVPTVAWLLQLLLQERICLRSQHPRGRSWPTGWWAMQE